MSAKYAIEELETRRLLAVTLNNGLPIDDPAFFQIVVGPGGEPTSAQLGGTEYLSEYAAFLDLGEGNTTLAGAAQVPQLSDFGSDPVLNGQEAVSQVVIKLADADDATDPQHLNNPVINAEVRVTVPHGTSRIQTSYSFSSFNNYSLLNATFFQFANRLTGPGQTDFLTVSGTVANDNLALAVNDTDASNFVVQTNGAPSGTSDLTGFGADTAGALRGDIVAGGYVAAANGTINIAPGDVQGLGAGYGPDADIATTLGYKPLSANSATVNTSIAFSPNVQGALMRVFYVAEFNTPLETETLVPDDTNIRSIPWGTDFGTELALPVQHVFGVRNRGLGNLVLGGTPTIQVSGDTQDFHVIRQSTPVVQPGGESYFIVQFLPTTPGLRTATISISSNDLGTTPYTFVVYGGTGTSVQPDIYEPDGNGDDPRAAQFSDLTPSLAKTISTDGVWMYHTLHKSNDVDWITFQLTEDTDVLVQTTTIASDLRMFLYNSAGQQIAFDLYSGVGQTPQFQLHLDAGVYYLRMDEYGNNAIVPLYGVAVLAGDGVQPSSMPIFLDGAGRLSVAGTDQGDTLSVEIFQEAVRVTRNSSVVFYPIKDVKSLNLSSYQGNDTIYVGVGLPAPEIHAGKDDDAITIDTAAGSLAFGGDGFDLFFGGAGNDSLQGNKNGDSIFGNGGDDYLQGGKGCDSIDGGLGNDTLVAGLGFNSLDGGAGDDLLEGGIYADTLIGGDGRDTINAGAGIDNIQALDGFVDEIFYEPSQDILTFDDGPLIFDVLNVLA